MNKQTLKNIYAFSLGSLVVITLYRLLIMIKEFSMANLIFFLIALTVLYKVTYPPYVLLKEKQNKKERE